MGGFVGVGWVEGGSGVALHCWVRVWKAIRVGVMGIFVKYKHTIYKKKTIIQIQMQIQSVLKTILHHRCQRSTNQTLPPKPLLTLLAHLPARRRRIVILVNSR